MVNQYFWRILRLGVLVRGTTAAAIYRRTLQFRLREGADGGQLANIISSDCGRSTCLPFYALYISCSDCVLAQLSYCTPLEHSCRACVSPFVPLYPSDCGAPLPTMFLTSMQVFAIPIYLLTCPFDF